MTPRLFLLTPELADDVPASSDPVDAFADAGKTGYPASVEELHPRLTRNGVVLLDDTLRSGGVLDPDDESERVLAALNASPAADPRRETVLLPLADGLTMLCKR